MQENKKAHTSKNHYPTSSFSFHILNKKIIKS